MIDDRPVILDAERDTVQPHHKSIGICWLNLPEDHPDRYDWAPAESEFYALVSHATEFHYMKSGPRGENYLCLFKSRLQAELASKFLAVFRRFDGSKSSIVAISLLDALRKTVDIPLIRDSGQFVHGAIILGPSPGNSPSEVPKIRYVYRLDTFVKDLAEDRYGCWLSF